MSREAKLTKAQRRTLEWFAAQTSPAILFDADGPTMSMRRWGVAHSYLATQTVNHRGMAWLGYTITIAGLAALSQNKDADHG